MGDAAEPDSRFRARWFVWPFAALGVVTAIAIVWLAVALSGEFRPRAPAVVAARGATAETLGVWGVGPLAGTGLIAIEICAVDEDGAGGLSKGSYYAGRKRNLLFLDRKTGSARRVLPNNSTLIADIDYFPAKAEDVSRSTGESGAIDEAGKPPAPPAYYLLVIERPQKDSTRVFDLLVGSLATGRQAVVMRGLSGLEQSGMIDDARLGVVVREGQTLYYRLIDIPALTQAESHKIDIG